MAMFISVDSLAGERTRTRPVGACLAAVSYSTVWGLESSNCSLASRTEASSSFSSVNPYSPASSGLCGASMDV